MTDRERKSGQSDGGHSDASSPFRFVCGNCGSAFDRHHDFCPNCSHPRPSEGWRNNRDVPDTWLGRIVGERYRLLQRMGKGTFGAVYRAKRRHLDDEYAVKIINLELAEIDNGPSLRERVEREAHILSSISSPHIVNVHDFLEVREQVLAVVMDFVRGKTLGQLLGDESQLELSRTIQFAIEIATGLREVHQRGVVHRDLKPENVMVQSLGRRREFIELIDFGVARFENEVRRTVGFIGTPRYTSPEQARGEDADNRSDIYTLGMLIYHMVVGEPPYTSNNVNELLAAHCQQEVPTMTSSAPDRTIPEVLESLVQSMMAKAPADRPDDMDVVLRALRPLRKKIEESKRHSSSLGAGREKRDSLPPSFDTNLGHGFGATHETSEYQRPPESEDDGEDNPFADRPPSDIYAVAGSDRIVYCDDHNDIRVQISNDEETYEKTLMSVSKDISAIACESADGIVVGHADGSIALANVQNATIETLFQNRNAGAVTSVATNPSTTRIVGGYEDGNVWYGGPETPPSKWSALETAAPVLSVAVHHDGSCIAVAREDATTDVYIPSRSRQSPTTVVEHDELPESIDFSPDGYLVAVRYSDGNVRLFSALTGAHVSDSPRSVLQASSIFESSTSSSDS